MKKTSFSFLVSILIITACTKQHNNTFKHFFLKNSNADLYVEINGNIASKIFFIYLHGGSGGGAISYNNGYFANEMEKDYAVVYLDQRGNGASQGNNTKKDLTIAQNLEDIYMLTKLLKAKYGADISIFLAGHSWGGLTAAHALIYTNIQNDLKGWIEMNGAHDFVKNDIEVVKMFQKLGQQEIDKGNNLDFWTPVLERVNKIDILNISDEDSGYLNSKGFEAETMFNLFDEETDSAPAYTLGAPDLSLATSVANGAVNLILNEDSYQHQLTNQLYQIEIPSLFLWGKYDFVVPPALATVYPHLLVNLFPLHSFGQFHTFYNIS